MNHYFLYQTKDEYFSSKVSFPKISYAKDIDSIYVQSSLFTNEPKEYEYEYNTLNGEFKFNSHYPVEVTCNQDWIQLTEISNVGDIYTQMFTMSENAFSIERKAVITVSQLNSNNELMINVAQAKAPISYAFTSSTTSYNASYNSGTVTLSMTSSCNDKTYPSATISGLPSWITLGKQTNANGTLTQVLNVNKNEMPSSRNCTINATQDRSGKQLSFNINQALCPHELTLVSASPQNVSWNTTSGTMQVDSKGGTSYRTVRFSESCDWITLGSVSTNGTKVTQNLTMTQNQSFDNSRSCTITAIQDNSNKKVEMIISQSKQPRVYTFTANTTDYSAIADGEAITLSMASSCNDGTYPSATVSGLPNWITLGSQTNSNGTLTQVLNIGDNNLSSLRNCTLEFVQDRSNKKLNINISQDKKATVIRAMYTPTATDSPTNVFSCPVESISEMSVNGVNTTPAQQYTFTSLEPTEVTFKVKPETTDTFSMFSNCYNLTSIDLSSFNTSKITNMNEMFLDCRALNSVTFPQRFGKACNNMSKMFAGCSSLKTIDLINLDTSNVTDMSYMFNSCSSLKSLDLSKFDTSNVTDMSYMFNSCSSLTSLDLASFDTSNVTSMKYIFSGCSSLTSIDFIKELDFSHVESISGMFSNCTGLTTVDLCVDLSHTKRFDYMFSNCSNLLSIDLSKANIIRAKSIRSIFQACSKLTSVNLGNSNLKGNRDRNDGLDFAFYGCSSLSKVDASGVNCCPHYDNNSQFIFEGVPEKGEFIANNNSDYNLYRWNIPSGWDIKKVDDIATKTDKVITAKYDFTRTYMNNFIFGEKFNLVDIKELIIDGKSIEPTYSLDEINDKVTVDIVLKRNLKSTRDMFNSCSGLTDIEVYEGFGTDCTDMAYMFANCVNLKSINTSSWDTSKVVSMEYLFSCCGVESLDLSSWDTSRVDNMSHMFDDCSSLTTLDLKPLNTTNVTSMQGMFRVCSSLTSLDLSNFDTSRVMYMDGMFAGCSGLTSLDLSNFDTSNLIFAGNMFYGCSNLTSLDLSNFDMSNVVDIISMFRFCSKLTSIDLSGAGCNINRITDYNSAFGGLTGNGKLIYNNDYKAKWDDIIVTNQANSLFPASWTRTYYEPTECKSLTITADNCTGNETNTIIHYIADVNGYNWNNGVKDASLKAKTLSGKTISNDFGRNPSDIESRNLSVSYTILGNTTNASIVQGKYDINANRAIGTFNVNPDSIFINKIDICSFKYLNINGHTVRTVYLVTSDDIAKYGESNPFTVEFYAEDNIVDMSYMFSYYKYLLTLDLTHLNTSKVTNMSSMFNGFYGSCSSLTSLDLTSLDTSNVTDMNNMFRGCSSLTSLDLTSLDTSKTTDISGMFAYCRSLTSINFGTIDTSSVTDMNNMFRACSSLTSLDLTPLKTTSVTDMNNMFNSCSGLTSINFGTIDTSSVTDMSSMFSSCSSLKTIDLSSLKTSNVTDMSSMFNSCSGLTSLNLTNFNTSKVTSMNSMFYYCRLLTSIAFSKNFGESCTNMYRMFEACSSLTSLNLTNFNTSKVNNVNNMFYGCSSLTSLDLKPLNTSNITNMSYMFYGCSSLNLIDFNGDKSNINAVSGFNNMFSGLPANGTLKYNNVYKPKWYNITNDSNSGLPSSWIKESYTISDCTSLSIIGYDCSGNYNKTIVKYAATVNAEKEANGNVDIVQLEREGFDNSHKFTVNPSTTDSRQVDVNYTYFGKTATATITQSPYVKPSITMSPNNKWIKSQNVQSPDSNAYSDVYQQLNYGVVDAYDTVTLNIFGVPNFELYVRDGGYGNDISFTISELDNKHPLELGNLLNKGTDLPSYTKISYPNDGKEHSITIMYNSSGYPYDENVGYFFWKKYEPTECTSLSITADDCSGNDTTTTVHYTAITNGIDYDTKHVSGITLTGDDISNEFTTNPSITEPRQTEVSYTYMNQTATTNITQSKYNPPHVKINLNGQWELSPDVPNPDPSLYEGVYQSINKGLDLARDAMTLSIFGLPNFELYVRSDGESDYDYLITSKLDNTHPNINNYQASTQYSPNSGTSLASYTKVSYPNDGKEHTITVLYRKNGSGSQGADRGYALWKKP